MSDTKFTDDHEWIRIDGDVGTVGITDHAQEQLGEMVFVELPEVGESFEKGEEFGTVESVKAVSELYLPVTGEVVAINSSLEESPEKVNNVPYGDGWMVEIKAESPAELDDLMNKDAYLGTLKG